jgi:hypothetical protein
MESLVRVPLKVDHTRVQREVILAKPSDAPNSFVVQSIPAFVYGVAYGDSVQVNEEVSGDFQVIRNSGQVTVRVFVKGDLEKPEIRSLIDDVCALGGLYEVGKIATDPNQKSLLLISLHISIGLSEIAKLLSSVKATGGQWEYGNIYDENGDQLGWWNTA